MKRLSPSHRTLLLALPLALLLGTASWLGWHVEAGRGTFARLLAKPVAATKVPAALAAPPLFAILTVQSTGDGPVMAGNCPGVNCRLRDAIAAAVAGDTIDFAVTGTITLTQGELVISRNLTIQGPGANVLTVSGNNASRVFNIAAGNFNVTLSGLTIANGRNKGTDVNVIGSVGSGSAGQGGGIYNASTGTVNVTSSTLSGNSATGGNASGVSSSHFGGAGQGGSIYNASTGTVNVTSSTLSGNSATGGNANADNSNNTGGIGQGGGIFNASTGTVNVTSSTLSGNNSQPCNSSLCCGR